MRLTRRSFGRTLFCTAALGAVRRSWAGGLPSPTEKTILTVSGKIGVANKDGAAQFDRPMLEAIGWSSFDTTTPWFSGVSKFEGILMDKLMDTVQASGATIIATALNDYATELPRSDFSQYGVLLALKRDGEYMPVKNKGPIFIVYPYDRYPELKHQKFYGRSAWQVSRLLVT
jgi:hypothetical protein